MADGVCAEGTANSVKDSVMKQTVDLLSISHKDCLNDKSLNALKSSFYINADSGELCSNFRINGVVGLGVHASAMLCGASNDMEFSSLCPNNGDNCRKKRCADRYDSSESSDSGVATLSCTDCSTSSSSSGTSDITDPGSPYSTTSTHSSASETSDDSSTAPGTPRKRALVTPPAQPVRSQWASTTHTSDSHSEESKDQRLWLQSAEVTAASTEEADSKPRTRNRSAELPPHSSENVNTSPKPTHVSRSCHWSLNKTSSNPSINMAPNVPSRQEQDNVEPCWPWGGKERSAIIERDKGPPPPPPPLAVTATPLTPVTANVIANPSVKLLKRQTAITSHKTAASTASSASVHHAKRLKVEHHSSKIGVKAGPLNNNSNINKNNNNNNNCVKVTSPCATSQRQQLPRCCTNHQKSQSISSQSHLKLKCCCADNNATTKSKCSSHDTSREASPSSKVSQQGKITEYFKTQVKPLNGVKKELASLVVKSNSEFRSPNSINKSVNVETNFCEAAASSLDKYFSNLLSGTKVVSKTTPRGTALSKSNEVKREIKTWTMGIAEGKLSKVPAKVTEKKTGGMSAVVSPSAHVRKLSSSSSSAKFLDSKRNSMNAASPKPANNTQNPIPHSCSPALDAKVAENNSVCSVPKLAASASETMTKPKTVTAEVSPPSPAIPVQSSSPSPTTMCAAEKSSISIDSSDVPSPILAVPTTIRFPATAHCASDSGSSSAVVVTVSNQGFQPKVIGAQSDVTSDTNFCRWSECNTHFDSSTGLLEHLQAKHVNPQVTCENYVCLWVGCKVYARTSCSRSWLERHVLSHGGNKPFRCIVDGCGQRFSSQTTLERHVNGHFNQTEAGNGNSGARRSLENATSKLFRRNGKKLRYRRQPWSARMFDYFDAGIMEGLQHRLMNMTEIRTQGNVATASGDTITLHSKVLARRVVADGRREILLRWFPEDILADEWVAESDVQRKRNVPIPSLPSSSLLSVQSLLFGRDDVSSQPDSNSSQHSRKHRRKPLKVT